MILVIDIGNTDTVLGVYDNDLLKHNWRIRTLNEITADEFNILVNALLIDKKVVREKIIKVVISSVVPSAVPVLNAYCESYLKLSPLWVEPLYVKTIMPILYDNPNEVGADRIVNAIAAFEKYQTSLIIIDFGTATTFDIISSKGEFIGGAIAPGIIISAEALFKKASRLPRVEIFKAPKNIIGKHTIESIQSGVIYGHAAMIDGMIERIKDEMSSLPKTIATGGLSPLISKIAKSIDVIEQNLTLEGLKLISTKAL